jgi:hypothetical protein
MARQPGVAIPEDAEELMAMAQARYPECQNFRFASDAIICQQSDAKFIHLTYRNLRKLAAKARAEADAPELEEPAPKAKRSRADVNPYR